ncbi:MAG: diaminopimelate epimerase [Bacteroidetes bacterium 43-16]|nr:MAG: diaminopimelate epimerase [Bacteroidetes bacterium 43-16]
MKINFFKYQGAGNDFVIIDNRSQSIQLTTEQVNFLCDRRFGIGADGLMLVEQAEGYDYRMVYFNADGHESTMCGNGGRCIAAFTHHTGVSGKEQLFIAIDGPHKANILSPDLVSLQMQDVDQVEQSEEATILNTGSPHFVKFVQDVATVDVYSEGKTIRNRDQFQPKGINVNFAMFTDSGLKVRTYERGVEDETLACGTGVTAAAIASATDKTGHITVPVATLGGMLEVSFDKTDDQHINNIWLKGPAQLVFSGTIDI